MLRKELEILIENGLKELQKKKALPVFDIDKIEVEIPENKEFGDYSSNIAMVLAKEVKESPQELAALIRNYCEKSELFEKVTIAGAGFINFFISKDFLEKEIKEILKKKDNYGKSDIGKGEKINVEFISANPTGPLHVGNARGGFCGDVLSSVLNKVGYKASREYYINNAGKQIEVLKDSLEGKEGYKNEYVDELIKAKETDPQKGAKYIISRIKETVCKMGITYDKWFWESDLKREMEEVKKILKKEGLTEEKDGALWFKSDQFEDDKERVLVRENGKSTYLLSDLAYLKNKFKRGFKKLIIFLGAEHHGYVGRIKAGAEALGYSKKNIIPIIMQLVRLIEDGKEVKMSKRTGIYITIDEVLEAVGTYVARFFFLLRNYGNHLDFDLDLARKQSNENPVFYVQYAYTRICSILKKAGSNKAKNISLDKEEEKELAKKLIKLPEILEEISIDYQVQKLPKYSIELAESFHRFYQKCQVISKDKKTTEARLSLVLATKVILKNTLDLMGVSAPEKM